MSRGARGGYHRRPMNQLFVSLGIEAWKPWLNALVLPPASLLLLALLGWGVVGRWPRLGRALVLLSVTGLWACSTPALGDALIHFLTRPPAGLGATERQALKGQPDTVVLVLGAGRRLNATDYGMPDVSALTLERVRYGAWLARQTGLPLAYSGGVGHGAREGTSEAAIVRQVVERDFGIRLRWSEDRSRDTNENAIFSTALLKTQGVRRIVLVTHGFHQRRALAAFERAVARSQAGIELVPAPMGLYQRDGPMTLGDFLPTAGGLETTGIALHEWLGRLAGA